MKAARLSLALLLLLAACDGEQSSLAPRGPAAEIIATLGWVMYAGAAAILLLVTALTLHAVRPRKVSGSYGGNAFIVGAGIVFPVVTLTALLAYALTVSGALTAPAPTDALRIEVTGKMWWWKVTYIGPNGTPTLVTANELRIPTGRPVEVLVESADVIHSFWVPSLAGKIDMIPGRTNRIVLQADEPAVLRGQCAEYCGLQHALMAFYVVALPPAAYDSWFAAQREPAREPTIPFLGKGRDAFIAGGCGACHTVRGTGAAGTLGPDLTHVGSRHSIGAGILPGNVGAIAGWIADSQHLKPGNAMPSFRQFDGETLRALAAYVESLK